MKRFFLRVLFAMFLIGSFLTSIANAEIKTIEEDGYYIMGDGMEENQKIAKERAEADAKRRASEQAGFFIESISELKNTQLTRDEIRTVSATVMEVIDSNTVPEINGDSIQFHCHIKVKVDTANVLKQLDPKNREDFVKSVQQYAEIEKENARLKAEIEKLKSEYAKADETQRQKISQEVKRNENEFTVTQLNEQTLAFLNNKEYKKAEATARKAISLDSENSVAWSYLALAYNGLKNYDKAIEYFNKSIELDPKNFMAWNNLGFAYNEKQQYDKAIEYFNKSIELDPKNSSAWNNLGLAYYYKQQYDKAIEYFNKSIELDPKNSISWGNLSFSYYQKGNYKKALEAIDKCIELDPNDKDAKDFREKIISAMK